MLTLARFAASMTGERLHRADHRVEGVDLRVARFVALERLEAGQHPRLHVGQLRRGPRRPHPTTTTRAPGGRSCGVRRLLRNVGCALDGVQPILVDAKRCRRAAFDTLYSLAQLLGVPGEWRVRLEAQIDAEDAHVIGCFFLVSQVALRRLDGDLACLRRQPIEHERGDRDCCGFLRRGHCRNGGHGYGRRSRRGRRRRDVLEDRRD
jgi:hypothetical protein